jgi:dimethylamine monooxygenase subunit A
MTRRPAFAPYADGDGAFRIGLRPLDLADWILPGPDAAAQFANKRQLYRERPGDVIGALQGSEAAQEETLHLIEAHAGRPDGGSSTGLPPIARAGLLVQEDLCLLQSEGGPYCLTAASLCAPSVWRLSEKLGLPLTGIHAPVPGYAEILGARVDRIFANLKPDMPVWRLNWSLMTEETLFLPSAHDRSPGRLTGLTAETAGERLFLRVERQTLRRLPETGAILFTIRTFIDPLACLGPFPELREGLKQAILGFGEAKSAYKAIGPIREAVLGWLEIRER